MIKPEHIAIERLRRSGPGGQHRNKKATGIRLTHLPTGIVIMATSERSQKQNLDEAMATLKKRLAARAVPRKKRKPTKPSVSSKERRLTDKRKTSEKKKMRSGVKFIARL